MVSLLQWCFLITQNVWWLLYLFASGFYSSFSDKLKKTINLLRQNIEHKYNNHVRQNCSKMTNLQIWSLFMYSSLRNLGLIKRGADVTHFKTDRRTNQSNWLGQPFLSSCSVKILLTYSGNGKNIGQQTNKFTLSQSGLLRWENNVTSVSSNGFWFHQPFFQIVQFTTESFINNSAHFFFFFLILY